MQAVAKDPNSHFRLPESGKLDRIDRLPLFRGDPMPRWALYPHYKPWLHLRAREDDHFNLLNSFSEVKSATVCLHAAQSHTYPKPQPHSAGEELYGA
jgi:hypothetical protein